MGGKRARTEPDDSERRFIAEWEIDHNATRAYRVAYPGSNYATANKNGMRMLRRPYIKREIEAIRAERRVRYRLRVEKVIDETTWIAFSDVLDFFNENGQLRNIREIPLEARRCIQSIKVRRDRITCRTEKNGDTETTTTIQESEVEYKLWNKLDALRLFYEHLGLNKGITPLDALLSVLPPQLAQLVKACLSGESVLANQAPARAPSITAGSNAEETGGLPAGELGSNRAQSDQTDTAPLP